MKDRIDHNTGEENSENNPSDPKNLGAVKAACRNLLGEDALGETDWELFASLQEKFRTLHDECQPFERAYYLRYPFGDVFHELAAELRRCMAISEPIELFEDVLACAKHHSTLISDSMTMRKFVATQLMDYVRIEQFQQDFRENFSEAYLFAKHDWEKVINIHHYLCQRDPRPGMEAALTAIDELKLVMAVEMQRLRTDVCSMYNEVFELLEEEAARQEVSCDVYADRRKTIARINACQSIGELEEFRNSLPVFRSQELIRILTVRSFAKGSVTGAVSYPVTGVLLRISNEEELNEYLEKLRKEMLSILETNRVIDLK